ncbi:DinB family protein [Pontibacter sp. G13]|uniref:DinB family protein n=1 Tax=Pontibacter sp. G13 TaxID=3074898 RepID=UPI00288A7478|nr:DinB family protein [Pontibacter sp. G13]WNJ18569.1 DinB family protein [Pontibacter sp. G13]
MIPRPNSNEYAEFYAGYVNHVAEDAQPIEVLRSRQTEVPALFRGLSEETLNTGYAPGKWTPKEMLGHIIDTERIFQYRALRIARGDQTPLPGFDQDAYMETAHFADRSLESLLDEYVAVRMATLSLFDSLSPDTYPLMGEMSGFPISVRGLAYITAGHEGHHLRILQERYL